jgi:hypothetical protein
MSDTAVHVHHLRLQAGRHAPVHGLRARVEDALRTSSKPAGLVHRFVLLRRLRLHLPPHTSAQALAQQLHTQWRRVEALAQPLAQAGDSAPAVWAEDEVQARLALLDRWLAGHRTTAWFWPRLLPGLDPAAPLGEQLHRLLWTPLDSLEPAAAPAGQRRLWREAWPRIAAAGQAASVLQRGGPARALALQQAVGAAERPPDGPAPPAAQTFAPRSQRHDSGTAPPRSAPPPAEIARSGPPGVPHRGAHDTAQAAAPPALSAPSTQRDRAPNPTHPPRHGPPGAALTTDAEASIHAPTPARPRAGTTDADRADATLAPQSTAWAGTWFVLPMLRQLQLDQTPRAPQALAALLAQLAQRHGLDAPVQHWLATHLPPPDRAAHAMAVHWHRALRLHALQQARLPLHRVMRRPGTVLLSPHRADVWLPLPQVDIRLRRAGFDLDPGWLPWLDCIVRFHYG